MFHIKVRMLFLAQYTMKLSFLDVQVPLQFRTHFTYDISSYYIKSTPKDGGLFE